MPFKPGQSGNPAGWPVAEAGALIFIVINNGSRPRKRVRGSSWTRAPRVFRLILALRAGGNSHAI